MIETNRDAPKGRVIALNPQAAGETDWRDVILRASVLNASSSAGYLFAEYMIDAISQVKQYDLDGNLIRDIELPDLGAPQALVAKSKRKSILRLPITALRPLFSP